MTDDIRALTARLADEPGSLAFLELGETLRRRGQLDVALKVARGGVGRYPGLADAHDLVARVLCDQGDLHGAFEAWSEALRIDPMKAGALKGIAFVYFQAGDTAAAAAHLERALDVDPDDPAIPAALARVRGVSPPPTSTVEDTAAAVPPAEPPALSFETTATGALLVDRNGMRLAGRAHDTAQRDVSDAVAAELAGVSKEASRTARLLGLGVWEHIAIESPDGHIVLVPPTAETVLLISSTVDVPMARGVLTADRAGREARAWLERER